MRRDRNSRRLQPIRREDCGNEGCPALPSAAWEDARCRGNQNPHGPAGVPTSGEADQRRTEMLGSGKTALSPPAAEVVMGQFNDVGVLAALASHDQGAIVARGAVG